MLNAHERAQDPSRAGRWRESLSEYELTRFERFAGGALDDLGYPPYERHASPTSARTESAGRTGAMRIVLGRESCGTLGGTETYAMTVAQELDRLGHDITLAAEDLGVASEVSLKKGSRNSRCDDGRATECVRRGHGARSADGDDARRAIPRCPPGLRGARRRVGSSIAPARPRGSSTPSWRAPIVWRRVYERWRSRCRSCACVSRSTRTHRSTPRRLL